VAEFQRQGALDHLSLQARAVPSLGEAAVGLGEIRYIGAVNLRVRRDDPDCRASLQLALAIEALPDTGAIVDCAQGQLLALGPDEWLLLTDDGPLQAERLDASTGSGLVGICNLTANYHNLYIDGAKAAEVLAKGCPLDLHESRFPSGRCAQTLIAKAEAIVYRPAGTEQHYRIMVRRSFAEYLFAWLDDAGREFGGVVLPPL